MSKSIAPSVLAADFGNLEQEIKRINSSKASWIHCDIMDGVFVPNISFGIPVVQKIAEISELPLDVHLMIINSDQYAKPFFEAGAKSLTIHYEGNMHLHRSIYQIKELGMQAGVAINPHTPVNVLTEVISDIDMVLIMSVNPGFGGQKFIPQSYDKIRELKELIQAKDADTLIQLDGGVDKTNAADIFEAGVDILVAGTAVFGAPDPVQAVDDLLGE